MSMDFAIFEFFEFLKMPNGSAALLSFITQALFGEACPLLLISYK